MLGSGDSYNNVRGHPPLYSFIGDIQVCAHFCHRPTWLRRHHPKRGFFHLGGPGQPDLGSGILSNLPSKAKISAHGICATRGVRRASVFKFARRAGASSATVNGWSTTRGSYQGTAPTCPKREKHEIALPPPGQTGGQRSRRARHRRGTLPLLHWNVRRCELPASACNSPEAEHRA